MRLLDVFEGKRYQKVVLVASVLIFLVLELLIFMTAASYSGQKSRVIITNNQGEEIFWTNGSVLTAYEKMQFESNYGPLTSYQMRVQHDFVPFPFRAWLSSAVGIPIGLILLVSFLVRVYLSLLYGDEKERSEEQEESPAEKSHAWAMFQVFHRISVFHIGVIIVIAVLLFWIVPNFLQDFARTSVSIVREYKWFFLGTSVFLATLITWIIYLRYRLSRQMLENQFNLEKYRVETQLLIQRESTPLLPNPVNEAQEPQ